MTTEESIARYGLRPVEKHLADIRAILADDVQAELDGRGREDDLALLCCVQLFSAALPDDSLVIWAAKSASFDLDCYLGIQLLCGAGLEATKRYLAGHPGPEAKDALNSILESEKWDDFENFAPDEYMAYHERYFRA